MTTEAEDTTFSPPYMAFTTLENMLERMRNDGIPSRIDRSYLVSWSGSAQAQFLKAARSLDLLDEYGHPTDLLKKLATEPDTRPSLIGALVEEKYPEARALGNDATPQQLEEVFRKYKGISGGTVRKAIALYLAAARFAGLPLSPFFAAPKAGGSGGTATRRPARRKRPGSQTPNGPERSEAETKSTGTDAKSRYIDLLLKKAEEDFDTDLLDRIEKVIGISEQTASSGRNEAEKSEPGVP